MPFRRSRQVPDTREFRGAQAKKHFGLKGASLFSRYLIQKFKNPACAYHHRSDSLFYSSLRCSVAVFHSSLNFICAGESDSML